MVEQGLIAHRFWCYIVGDDPSKLGFDGIMDKFVSAGTKIMYNVLFVDFQRGTDLLVRIQRSR